MKYFTKRMGGRVYRALAWGAAAIMSVVITVPSNAQATLKDKTVQLFISGGVGGGVDVHARAFIIHLAKHLPGSPSIVAQNMPGAGGQQGALALHNIGRGDGTTFATFNPGALTAPFIGKNRDQIQYDIRKFQWIGSLTRSASNCMVWHTSPVKTIEDSFTRETTISVSGIDSGGAQLAKIYNAVLGTKFKLIAGYPGTGDALLALEREEVDGTCNSVSSVRTTRADWLRDKKLRMLVQTTLRKDPDFPDVPTVLELVKNDLDRQAFEFIIIPYDIQNPFALPGNASAEILAIYRKAFDATIADPAFLADTKKRRMEIEPHTGQEVAAMVAKFADTPRLVLDKIISATEAR